MRDGTYPPGSRLPTHRRLMAEFGTSPVTLQRAFDHLVEQGYVTTVAKHGTFVAERLPDSCCYGLVFHQRASGPVHNRFWSTLLREGQAWDDGHGRRFDCFFIADGEGAAADRRRLAADVADGRLAGLVFANVPFYLQQPAISPILTAGLPRVCFGGMAGDEQRYGASILVPDDEDVIRESFTWFAGQRRKRVAAFINTARAQVWRSYLPALHRAGLETRDTWWIGFPPISDVADAVRVTTRLLFDRRPHERPDALLIDDDNLVPWVTAGLAESGLAIPGELSVMAHANVPGPTPAAVPCRRYGFDGRELLAAAIGELERLRRGGQPQMRQVPARVLVETDGTVC